MPTLFRNIDERCEAVPINDEGNAEDDSHKRDVVEDELRTVEARVGVHEGRDAAAKKYSGCRYQRIRPRASPISVVVYIVRLLLGLQETKVEKQLRDRVRKRVKRFSKEQMIRSS